MATKAPAAKTVKAPVIKAEKPTVAMDAPSAVVSKMIASIMGRGAKLDKDIHSTAMACLYHADKHGDITLMNKLMLAMPKSTRRNALGQWAIAFGKFAENTNKDESATVPLVYDKASTTDLTGASEKPFWDFRNVREGTNDWQFTNYIEGVMKTLANRAVGDGPEAMKAKAAFDALKGVSEAIAIPAKADEAPALYVPGSTPERRAAMPH